jgi:hypothetical protein
MAVQAYTHLLPEEVRIWEKFLPQSPWTILQATYDLHLGAGAEIDPSWPAWLVAQARAVTRKRVDVVVETPDEIVIIEIKPRAGMAALGQVLTYKHLYEAEFAPAKPVRAVVLAERKEPDVDAVYATFGVGLLLV